MGEFVVSSRIQTGVLRARQIERETNIVYRKFLVLFVFGFRMKAIAILGREVMLPRGLVGLGTDTLDCSGAEIREVRYIVQQQLGSDC